MNKFLHHIYLLNNQRRSDSFHSRFSAEFSGLHSPCNWLWRCFCSEIPISYFYIITVYFKYLVYTAHEDITLEVRHGTTFIVKCDALVSSPPFDLVGQHVSMAFLSCNSYLKSWVISHYLFFPGWLFYCGEIDLFPYWNFTSLSSFSILKLLLSSSPPFSLPPPLTSLLSSSFIVENYS